MMIVLDTNIISECLKADVDPVVSHWVNTQFASNLFITTITEAELNHGISILPRGRKRQALATSVEVMLESHFADRILPFDRAAAHFFAEVMSDRRRSGRPISLLDAQIAAIARSRDAAIATRNVIDFELCGVEVINPWGK